MKDIFVALVGMVVIIFVVCYTHQIKQSKKSGVVPTLSTWITFVIGTGLSLLTYLLAEEGDWRSGILNTMDFLATVIILLALVYYGGRKIVFRSFEKWYLGGVSAIVLFGIISQDAWRSNIFTQMLIGLGYIPTILSLHQEKRNVESYVAWVCGLSAGILALYPSIQGGNVLAVIYSVRTIVFVILILALMTYYQRQSRLNNDVL